MLALYPSNKLEHLSYLLSALLDQQSGEIFAPQTILVESPGMQHWVNMELARRRQIAMNLSFPLPVRFMWECARAILGEKRVPRQSPYRREVLMWRIDRIICDASFCEEAHCQPVCEYWQSLPKEQGEQQRLQLSTALADVFEQYLLYRPDWLEAWENHASADTGLSDEAWQSEIWRRLVAEQPDHPARLHKDALAKLAQGTTPTLPSKVIVFAINTMAPQLVQFLDALSHHTDIHIFHLNPSVSYWGESKTNRQQARLLREEGVAQWQQERQDNPLLGNLGQQGRDLFNLLTALDTFEVSAFDTAAPESQDATYSLLAQIQTDILDGKAPDNSFVFRQADTSFILASGHNPLREVQGLHDQLLRYFEADPSLRPSDVVVMCPAIEDYAPFIDAVFHRVGSPVLHQPSSVRLPCSVADRAPLDAEPMISAFINMLSLPESRFEVSSVMDYLRLLPVQRKFGFSEDDLDTLSFWLHQAHIHWGKNGQHKAHILGKESASDTYSWEWGLRRLLDGMIYKDEPVITGHLLTVPDIEGQQVVLLGKLIELLNQLAYFAGELRKPRTPKDWHDFLAELRHGCFDPDRKDMDSWESVAKATADLYAQCEEAGYHQCLTLQQVRSVLTQRFSSPDAGNHFMTGQVTFCSMLPMRSIPFKVVCILGLNDGEFPRLSTPLSIDMMAATTNRIGDRSRRQEDRYLFLEAIISARQHLYLSYQGNRSQDNSAREPSLVLAELLSVLRAGYGYDPDKHMRQLALHPFSAGNFGSEFPSFDAGWFRLAHAIQKGATKDQGKFFSLESSTVPERIDVEALARAFDNPLRFFANQRLGVNLQQNALMLDDAEPFSENNLVRYQILSELVNASMTHATKNDIRLHAQLTGDLPDTPLTPALLDEWEAAADTLVGGMGLHTAEPTKISYQINDVEVEAHAWVGSDGLQLLHHATQNPKRQLMQFLTLLCFNANGNTLPLDVYYLKKEKETYQVRRATYQPFAPEEAQRVLYRFIAAFYQLHTTPFPVFVGTGLKLVKAYVEQKDASLSDPQAWQSSLQGLQTWRKVVENVFVPDSIAAPPPLNDDEYVKWFYPQGLSLSLYPFSLACDLFKPLLECHGDKKQ